MADYDLDDQDEDLDEDEDDDVDEDDEDSDDEDDDDEEVETWQVGGDAIPLKVGLSLTSGVELPRLTRISSSTGLDEVSAGVASRRR